MLNYQGLDTSLFMTILLTELLEKGWIKCETYLSVLNIAYLHPHDRTNCYCTEVCGLCSMFSSQASQDPFQKLR